MKLYYPEGELFLSDENREIISSPLLLEEAYRSGRILEARAVMCDAAHNMIVEISDAEAVIPREEGALGIADGTTRDIALLSKVNKPICFVIDHIEEHGGRRKYILSRAKAQRMCMDEYVLNLLPGEVIDARVTHLEPFGAFVDIGCGIPSLIPIDSISISRISHPNDCFYNGQSILAVVKAVEGERVYLTHKELLGTWEQNCERFEIGSTVAGIVRSVESYGIFIEIAPNLAGLAEPREGIYTGQSVSVNIKAIKPDKMKLKLAIVDTLDDRQAVIPLEYFITQGRIKIWEYSPRDCQKCVVSQFY